MNGFMALYYRIQCFILIIVMLNAYVTWSWLSSAFASRLQDWQPWVRFLASVYNVFRVCGVCACVCDCCVASPTHRVKSTSLYNSNYEINKKNDLYMIMQTLLTVTFFGQVASSSLNIRKNISYHLKCMYKR